MTGSKYRTEIDEWMDAHLDEMTEDLKMLVRIPSVRGDAEEGKPYGKEAARVLQAMQERMAAFGLKTRNYENYCVTGDLDGENEKTLDIAPPVCHGILCNLGDSPVLHRGKSFLKTASQSLKKSFLFGLIIERVLISRPVIIDPDGRSRLTARLLDHQRCQHGMGLLDLLPTDHAVREALTDLLFKSVDELFFG